VLYATSPYNDDNNDDSKKDQGLNLNGDNKGNVEALPPEQQQQ
jgi:hypothetical protein